MVGKKISLLGCGKVPGRKASLDHFKVFCDNLRFNKTSKQTDCFMQFMNLTVMIISQEDLLHF